MKIGRELIDKILTYLMFAGAIYALVFFILKAAGVIKTPSWMQLSPFIALIFTVILFLAKVMNFVSVMRPLPARVNRMAKGLTKLEIRFDYLEKDVNNVKDDLGGLKKEMGTVNERLSNVDDRLTDVDGRLSNVDSSTARMSKKIDLLSKCRNFSA